MAPILQIKESKLREIKYLAHVYIVTNEQSSQIQTAWF